MKGKYLITTNNWFYAPDGQQYKAVWGDVEIVSDEILGIKTNRNSTNWFAKVKGDKQFVIIAGCQISYAVMCEDPPNTEEVPAYSAPKGKRVDYIRPSNIFIPK